MKESLKKKKKKVYEEIETNNKRWFDLTPLLNEEFRDIEGYEGLYQVSNYGRVKSKYKVLKQIKNKQGYFMTELCKKYKHKFVLTHRLVAQTFIPNPNNKKIIDHIEEVTKEKCNNRVDNLQWCTQKENMQKCIKRGRFAKLRGKLNGMSKSVLLLDNNGKIIKEFENSRYASKELKLCPSSICNYLKKRYKNPKINLIYKEEYYERENV